MLGEIRKLVKQTPFIPFTIHLADGRRFRIGHPDYLFVGQRFHAVFEHDDGTLELLPGLLVSGVTVHAEPTAAVA
jgi:hypothetical protein